MERREFVKMMGIAPGALAASWNLDFAQDELVSKVRTRDEHPLPDQSVFFPAGCTECPAACGLRVQVRRGHPIQLEGNPEGHPGSGGLCVRGQASLARLYHPERVRQPIKRGDGKAFQEASWEEAFSAIDAAWATANRRDARGVYFSARTGDAGAALIEELAARRGLDVLPEHELWGQGALKRAYADLFGREVLPYFTLEGAGLVISLGADLFEGFVDPVRFATEFADFHHRGGHWIHLEANQSLTGCSANERIGLPPGSEALLLAYLLRATGGRQLSSDYLAALPAVDRGAAAEACGLTPEWLDGLVSRIRDHAGRLLVLAGGTATAQIGGLAVAKTAALLQQATGQIGRTVRFDLARRDRTAAPGVCDRAIAERLDRPGRPVGPLFVSRIHSRLGLPSLPRLVEAANLSVAFTDVIYEPLEGFDWILPLSHALESHHESIAPGGERRVFEPVFDPLFDTRSEVEILLALIGREETAGAYLTAFDYRRPGEARAPALRRGAHDGLSDHPPTPGDGERTLVVGSSVRGYDGRSRAIGLLHEIPDPLTAVSYGDYLVISAEDATAEGLTDGDVAEIEAEAGVLRLPVRVMPGQPKGIIGVGLDIVAANHAGSLRLPTDSATGDLVCVLPGVTLRTTGTRIDLPILSGSMDASGRGILPGDTPHHGPGHGTDQGTDASDSQTHAAAAALPGKEKYADPPASMYKPHPHKDYRWAMAIDLEKCIGCSACVAACYIENNIAITGPDEHLLGREMSWIRVQPYEHHGRIEFIPMLCQHCDYAPCEAVCPIFATYHNPEGLNAQVYNRCVGTRYCANNCPYKVRRFNWFSHPRQEPLDLLLNPDVSVRPKGVMEKCTFCIQRIREAKDVAKDEGRKVRDGEVVPACAQSCPTRAIVFGNLLDPSSEVYALIHSKRAYRILEELGTGPAVYYLHEDVQHEL